MEDNGQTREGRQCHCRSGVSLHEWVVPRGPGHILDAIALCQKHGGDATHWNEVAEYLMLKSHKEYYCDPVVKCGYYPGKHTVNYVNEVMDRYNGYVITKKEE